MRKFIELGFSRESFIRVSIGDENTDKLFSDDISQAVEVRIQDLVLNGITLGKRKYVFLAYSSSQLKEQSLWMVSPEHGWNVPMMRNSMGDFSMCKTPSKYAARIGQCFSTTVDTAVYMTKSNSLMSWATDGFGISDMSRGLRVNDNLPDIVSGSGLEHSDGVGLIRKEVLEVILNEVPFGPMDKKDISAIQVRYGGAKGGKSIVVVFVTPCSFALTFSCHHRCFFSACCLGFLNTEECKVQWLRHCLASKYD